MSFDLPTINRVIPGRRNKSYRLVFSPANFDYKTVKGPGSIMKLACFKVIWKPLLLSKRRCILLIVFWSSGHVAVLVKDNYLPNPVGMHKCDMGGNKTYRSMAR